MHIYQAWGQVHLKVKYKYFRNLSSTSTSTPVEIRKVDTYLSKVQVLSNVYLRRKHKNK